MSCSFPRKMVSAISTRTPPPILTPTGLFSIRQFVMVETACGCVGRGEPIGGAARRVAKVWNTIRLASPVQDVQIVSSSRRAKVRNNSTRSEHLVHLYSNSIDQFLV